MKSLALILMTLALCSCDTVSKVYLASDRATFDAITPEYVHYVESDHGLTPKDKEIRLRTVKTWADRLKQFEGVSK